MINVARLFDLIFRFRTSNKSYMIKGDSFFHIKYKKNRPREKREEGKGGHRLVSETDSTMLNKY